MAGYRVIELAARKCTWLSLEYGIAYFDADTKCLLPFSYMLLEFWPIVEAKRWL